MKLNRKERTQVMSRRPQATQASPSLARAPLAALGILASFASTSCATLFPSLAKQPAVVRAPISNPFGDAATGVPGSAPNDGTGNIVFRTRKGDRAVEVEIPGGDRNLTDVVMPVSPAFKDRSPASAGEGESGGLLDERYRERKPSLTDREIASAMPVGGAAVSPDRQLIEQELGVVASGDSVPERDGSYLAAVDHVKQLYRNARFEAALLEVDDLLRLYPTDPKLHEMRGTLLDRTGRTDLAMRSWNQALSLSPDNASLRRFVERKQLTRSLAGQRGSSPATAPATDAGSANPATAPDPSLQEGAKTP